MSAKTYRKKPVVVEAMEFKKPFRKVLEFCPQLQLIKGLNNRIVFGSIPLVGHGGMIVAVGDFISRDDQGNFHQHDAHLFKQDYEEVAA